jgi:anti-sigma-K factor RskA
LSARTYLLVTNAGLKPRVFRSRSRDSRLRPHHPPCRRGSKLELFGSFIPTATLAFFLATTRSDLNEERRIVATLLRSDDALRLVGEDAVAAVVPSDGGSIFVGEGLDEVPDDKTYQLWLLDEDGRPISAGTFDVDDGRAVLETEQSLQGFSGAAVTVEPEGGSEGPTSDPVLAPESA